MNVRVGLLLVGFSVVACAGTPPPPVVPDGEYEYEFKNKKTGDPLTVKGESFTYTTNERVEVAQREMYDSQGRRIGSDRIYANQQVARRGYQWDVYQGSHAIDVLSALHIARDKEFEKAFAKRLVQINQDRENALPYYDKVIKDTAGARTIGLGVGVVGVGAALALLIIGAAVTPDGESASAGFIWGSTGLFIVGGLGFGVMGRANAQRSAGAAKAQEMANAQVSPGNFPRLTSEAYVAEAADRYNDGLSSAPPPPPKDTKKKKPKR